MPGVISRDGVIISMPVLTEEQRSRMLDSMVAAFMELHPDLIRDKIAELQKETPA